MYTAIILEDEKIALERLERLLNQVACGINITGRFELIAEVVTYLNMADSVPDILFLDIEVGDGNSMILFDQLEIKSHVIFTTAYDKYAVEAFKHKAIHYLLKPVKVEELEEALNRIISSKDEYKATEAMGARRLLVKFGNKLHNIAADDIAYVRSINKISYIYTTGGDRIPTDYRMQDFESMLDDRFFFRANRQYIVHIDAIREMIRHDASRLKLTLAPEVDDEIVVSTEKARVLKEWLVR